MPEQLKTNTVKLTDRQAFIVALPCFAMLSPVESQELAALMTAVHYASGEKIIEEGDIVDSVFIIASGDAEVSHFVAPPKPKLKLKIKFRKKPAALTKVPVAMLHAGEAIGLNDTGFFSATGKRTATIFATTDVIALRLDLASLHAFLKHHPHLSQAMFASSEQMLRVKFIKQSLPFSRLSHERLNWLANQVEIRHVKAGEIIFAEGDLGDRCYLIRSGHVEIVTKHEDGSEHQLAVLQTPTLFGEATLITHSPRNATARAVDDGELLELRHKYLSELIESEGNVASMFMTLSVDRSRPQQNPHVSAHERVTPDEQVIVILKNPDNGSYFKLSEEGWFIWQQMNGKQTMQEITLSLAEEYNVFAPDVVAALISKLTKAGFVVNVDVIDESKLSTASPLSRVLIKVRRVLEARYAFGDADKWLTSVYNKGAYLVFSHTSKFVLGFYILFGLAVFGYFTPYVILLFRTIHDSWFLILCVIPCTLLSVALHELGHALATKSYGNEVHYMGVGWYWLGPVAFTDTSDMWLSTRWPRIFVNLAGFYTDMLVAGTAAVLILVVPSERMQAFLWLFALYTYLSGFRMLNPLQELDGYYVLMDLFDTPRLRQVAIVWLLKGFPQALRQPSLFKQHLPELFYWIACILFIVLVSMLTLFVQTFVFKILGFKPSNPIISLTLPIFAAVVSSLGIIADLRKAEE